MIKKENGDIVLVNKDDHPLLQKFQELGIKVKKFSFSVQENGLILTIQIVVKPGSKLGKNKEAITILDTGDLLLNVLAQPVEGAANKEVIYLLAKTFGMAPRHIQVDKGERSRCKMIIMEYLFTPNKNVNYYKEKLDFLGGKI